MMATFLLSLTVIVRLFFYADIVPTETTKGCVMCGCTSEGNQVFKYFVKVADDENDDPDTGEHQIWGFDPDNKVIKNKKIVFERVHEKDFLKAGRVGRKAGYPCTFRCPMW